MTRRANSTVRFSIDPRHHFRGPVPSAVRCPDAGRKSRFTCAKTGYPNVPLGQLIDWTADWVGRGMPSLGKDTHFDARDGNF